MLDFVSSLPARIAAAGVPVAATLAVLAAAGLLIFIASQLRPEQPEPRHRPHTDPLPVPISAPPVPAADPEPFDPLDERTSLEEVEAFLASLDEPAAALTGDTDELATVQ